MLEYALRPRRRSPAVRCCRASFAVLACIAACGPKPSATPAAVVDEPADCARAAQGDPSMFRAPDGIEVDEPQLCEGPSSWDSGGYVRVHGSGTRQLVLGREAFERACPGVAVEHAQCEAAVLIDALGRAVIDQLRAENALGAQRFGGIGKGVCGEVTDPLDDDAFHPSISVFDWRDAEVAVRAVHRTMADWDLGGHFGVSVRGMACAYTTDPRIRDLAHEPVFGSEVRFDAEP